MLTTKQLASWFGAMSQSKKPERMSDSDSSFERRAERKFKFGSLLIPYSVSCLTVSDIASKFMYFPHND